MIDVSRARANLDRKYEARRLHSTELFRAATEDSRAIVEYIGSAYRPSRIYQWGSLLHAEQFDENSDIDIAVEGLDSASAWFALTGKALAMTNLPLDIVELEHVGPPDRESILSKGRLVHGRSTR
jgi:predicted nucleotidyltransferase